MQKPALKSWIFYLRMSGDEKDLTSPAVVEQSILPSQPDVWRVKTCSLGDTMMMDLDQLPDANLYCIYNKELEDINRKIKNIESGKRKPQNPEECLKKLRYHQDVLLQKISFMQNKIAS